MDFVLVGGFSGAAMVLAAFALRTRMVDVTYNTLNCVGSMLLAANAAFNYAIPQLLLNVLWLVVSIRNLVHNAPCKASSIQTSAASPATSPTSDAPETPPDTCEIASLPRGDLQPFSPRRDT